MKNYLSPASILMALILMALILFATPDSSSAAQVHREVQTTAGSTAPQLLELNLSELSQNAPSVKVPQNCQNITPDVQKHGGKGYVIEPSPALKQHLKNLVGKTKGYGEVGIDRQVVDSFKLKNCRVCHATIEYQVSNKGLGWEKDSFVAAIAPFTDGNKYFITPPNKCNQNSSRIGCIWDKSESDKKSKTVTLEIQPSQLTTLNSYLATGPIPPTYLDIRGEDDTTFDYVTLRVWYY